MGICVEVRYLYISTWGRAAFRSVSRKLAADLEAEMGRPPLRRKPASFPLHDFLVLALGQREAGREQDAKSRLRPPKRHIAQERPS